MVIYANLLAFIIKDKHFIGRGRKSLLEVQKSLPGIGLNVGNLLAGDHIKYQNRHHIKFLTAQVRVLQNSDIPDFCRIRGHFWRNHARG